MSLEAQVLKTSKGHVRNLRSSPSVIDLMYSADCAWTHNFTVGMLCALLTQHVQQLAWYILPVVYALTPLYERCHQFCKGDTLNSPVLKHVND